MPVLFFYFLKKYMKEALEREKEPKAKSRTLSNLSFMFKMLYLFRI